MKFKRNRTLLLRIRALYLMLYLAWKEPVIAAATTMNMMTSLYQNIMRVAEEKTHLRTQINLDVQTTDGVETIEVVSLWIGSGIGADPHRRIAELVSEVEKLKLALYYEQKGGEGNTKYIEALKRVQTEATRQGASVESINKQIHKLIYEVIR
jgi:hypothetical protein